MRGSLIAAMFAVACGPTGHCGNDGGTPPDDGRQISCDPSAGDQQGCACGGGSPARACYSSDASTRNVGVCHDGTQACLGGGEFGMYDVCQGEILPGAENCTNGLDDNCDGTIDCADPTCATDPACRTGCTDGQTRPCYDGPTGTDGVGTCRDGTQTCANSMWPANCPGEVLPGTEDCATLADKNCNHLPGCLDIFACLNSPACVSQCQITMPGCVCPTGNGDNATCPAGMLGITTGGFPGNVECCPCTASDCGNAGCCGESVCAGNPACGGLTCNSLPPACNGQVNFDCDDFPEDCDEPCCKCTMCP